jgi:tetratricopeptide (TPR) repeat protein
LTLQLKEDVFSMDILTTPPAQFQRDKESLLKAVRAAVAEKKPLATLKIDYPLPNSLFPPDLVAPTYLFHDSSAKAKFWLADISVAGEPGHLYVVTDGRKPKSGIDLRCVAKTNVYPEPEYKAQAKGWTASQEIWSGLTRQSEKEITVTLYGLANPEAASPAAALTLLSQGTVSLKISKDPVGAPIFYRDVPLMPTVNQSGTVMPLDDSALPLVEWRLRDLTKPESRVVLKDIPTCANCHSFSQDGKYLGMNLDLPKGDKGSYAFARIEPQMVIQQKQIFSWSLYNPAWLTYGLFSRVSPDGAYVVSSVNEKVFVTNYLDFRFLQTFYPTQGILAVYNRQTGKVTALPGADKSEYVQANAVWTPDGRSLVFIRAKATNNIPAGPRPVKANDPNEVQIKYDLYSIPFNDGRGGEAQPVPGASSNGKSNAFPKISPDGKWIVWVQAENGLLMRPDSQLYIMPPAGGQPRRMTCNLPLMNSWHSWSPNSRWLVFSSKADTPFTQMYLTHIDEQGHDSPAILIPNSTAANRAVNIPEFVNIKPDQLMSIDAPAIDYSRHLRKALALIEKRELPGAFKELQTAEEMKPGFRDTEALMGYYYRELGDTNRAIEIFTKILASDPRYWPAHNYLGIALYRLGRYEEALKHFQVAFQLNPGRADIPTNLAVAEFTLGNKENAKQHLLHALQTDQDFAKAHYYLGSIFVQEKKFGDAAKHLEKCIELSLDFADALGNLAWLYATCPDGSLRNGRRALELAQRYERLADRKNPSLYDILGAAYAETGQFEKAVQMAEKALQFTEGADPSLELRRRLLDLYKSGKPYHGQD